MSNNSIIKSETRPWPPKAIQCGGLRLGPWRRTVAEVVALMAGLALLGSCSTTPPTSENRPRYINHPSGMVVSSECAVLSTPEPALAALSDAESFSGPHVGIGSFVPPTACAFVTLWKQPDAARWFERLLEDGKIGGQLYAMCGLYLTNTPLFETALPRYISSGQNMWTFFGCMLANHPVSAIVKGIRNGRIAEEFVDLANRLGP